MIWLIFPFILFLFYLTENRRKFIFRFIILFLFTIFIISVIALILKVAPFRVYYPIFAFIPIFLIFEIQSFNFKKSIYFYFILIFSSIAVIKYYSFWNYYTKYKMNDYTVLLEQFHFFKQNKNTLFVNWGDALKVENVIAYKNFSEFKDLNLYSIGCGSQMTYSQNILKKNNIDDLYLSITQEKDIFVFVKYPVNNSKLYIQFMKEHYNIDVDFHFVYKNKINVLKYYKKNDSIQ